MTGSNKTLIHIIKNFVCFSTLVFCCSVQANQLESYLENLRKDIGQKKPVYAVSVTRTIKNRNADYSSLSSSERFIVFSILNVFLGMKGKDEAVFNTLQSIISVEFHRFEELCKKREEYRLISLKTKVFMENQAEAVYKEIYCRFISKTRKTSFKRKNFSSVEVLSSALPKIISMRLNNQEVPSESLDLDQKAELDICIRDQLEKAISLTFRDTLEKEEKALIEFWEGNKKEKVLERYFEFYSKIAAPFFMKPALTVDNKAIVAFNEMFFGKNTPFHKGILEDEVKHSLSVANPSKMFHVNFLTIEEKNFQEMEDLKLFIDKNKGDNWRFYTGVQKFNQQENSYDFYVTKILESLQYPVLKILENISRVYIAGNEEAFYNKSSYQKEDDDSLIKGSFYVFGKGIDKLSSNIDGFEKVKQKIENLESIGSDCAHSEYLCQLYIKANERIVPSFISTEICYDLELGVRNKNYHFYYPEDLTIHIVPSNTLPFKDENLRNLPHHSDLIFHVDPEESALYEKVPTFSIKGHNLEFQKTEGKCSYICQFEFGENIYLIKAWNLSTFLHSVF